MELHHRRQEQLSSLIRALSILLLPAFILVGCYSFSFPIQWPTTTTLQACMDDGKLSSPGAIIYPSQSERLQCRDGTWQPL
jgi:hypothetical protein